MEETVKQWVREYADDGHRADLFLDVLPVEEALAAVERGEFELAVTGGDPPDLWFATPIDTDGIAVVVHPTNPIRFFEFSELGDIFAGRKQNWELFDGRDRFIQTVIPPNGDEVRTRFQNSVLGFAPHTPTALLGPYPSAVAAIVSTEDAAVGYMPASQVPDHVTIVRVNGLLPEPSNLEDGRYPLAFSIIATAPDEPTGKARDWLVWLQLELDAGETQE